MSQNSFHFGDRNWLNAHKSYNCSVELGYASCMLL